MRAVNMLDEFRQALRRLAHAPSFAATAILTLALGVGANGAVFSLLDRIFLRAPAGVEEPSDLRRLYAIRRMDRTEDVRGAFSLPELRDIDSTVGRSGELLGYLASRDMPLSVGTHTRRVSAAWVSPNYFAVLGVSLAAGQGLSSQRAFGTPASEAVISWRLFQLAFDGDPAALGASMRAAGQSVTVVGVASRGFSGVDVEPVDVWLQFSSFPDSFDARWFENRGQRLLHLIGRLREDESQAELASRAQYALRAGARAERELAAGAEVFGDTVVRVVAAPILVSRGPEELSQASMIVLLLSGVAALLLLVTITNVGSLLLTRALERRREAAIRAALGASRGHLLWSFISESLLIALASAVVATLFANWAGSILRALLVPDVQWLDAPVDSRVFVVTLAVALAGAVLAALIPLRELRRLDPASVLQGAAGGLRTGPSGVRATLVALQAAFSVILLVGAGLFARSLENVRDIPLGYDAERTIIVSGGENVDPAHIVRLAEFARGVPAVERVALADASPLEFLVRVNLYASDGSPVAFRYRRAAMMSAEPGYLPSAGLSIILGRDLNEADAAGAPPVMVVSRELARAVWDDVNAVGRCLRVLRPRNPCYAVVGISEDVASSYSVFQPPELALYVTEAQRPGRQFPPSAVVIRAASNADAVANQLRVRIRELAGAESGIRVTRVSEHFAPQYRNWALGSSLFAILGALALIVANGGLYGVLSYVVGQRRRELGIRIALGASAANVAGTIVLYGLRYVALGAAAGVGGAIIAARTLSAFLFGVPPDDPVIIAFATFVLLVTGVVAALVPAGRAAASDPMLALKGD